MTPEGSAVLIISQSQSGGVWTQKHGLLLELTVARAHGHISLTWQPL